MIIKKILAGGLIADVSYVMAANVPINVIPSEVLGSSKEADYIQIAAALCGVVLLLSRAVKTIAEAYLIKKKADAISNESDQSDEEEAD